MALAGFIYFMFNILVLSILMATKSTFGVFFHKGFKVKHLIMIIVFPVASVLAKLLDMIGRYIQSLITSESTIKNFLNKPIVTKKK